MPELRILVVEDQERWQEQLQRTLNRLSDSLHIDIAPDYSVALQAVANQSYDLATVDLALRGDSDQLGMELLRELRNSRYNRDGCGLIVLTAYATTARARQAFRDYDVNNFIDKMDFDEQVFVDAAREAIRNTRLRRAAARSSERYRLTITCGQDHFVGSELTGPDRRANYTAERPVSFNVADLVRRTDNVNIFVLHASADVWRQDVRAIGEEIYRVLAEERRILGDLVAARALAERFSDLWIQFSSPAIGLGLPFELLRDDEPLGLRHILTRRLHLPGANMSRKPEPFHTLIQNLLRQGERLRVLVVGANTDGAIPEAEAEAQLLETQLRADLERLGVAHEVRLLVGERACYAEVCRELREGRYHIFHYAGHGRHSDTLPEISGLVLHDDQGSSTLTAADLNVLTRDTTLHMVYLSCCLGARTAQQTGRGDFYGMLEALARADIPVVLGYRWTVADEPASSLAVHFYRELWRSFSPGEALLAARREIATGPRGRDDETWMSPVLLMQNV